MVNHISLRYGLGVSDSYFSQASPNYSCFSAVGRWSFIKGGRSFHAIFGWSQIGAIVPLRNGLKDEWTEYPWLADHPHVHRTADPRNVIYVALDELMLPGVEFTGLKGGASVLTLDEQRTLTDPTSRNRSTWRLPPWFQAGGWSISVELSCVARSLDRSRRRRPTAIGRQRSGIRTRLREPPTSL